MVISKISIRWILSKIIEIKNSNLFNEIIDPTDDEKFQTIVRIWIIDVDNIKKKCYGKKDCKIHADRYFKNRRSKF